MCACLSRAQGRNPPLGSAGGRLQMQHASRTRARARLWRCTTWTRLLLCAPAHVAQSAPAAAGTLHTSRARARLTCATGRVVGLVLAVCHHVRQLAVWRPAGTTRQEWRGA
jgi:hypothetical protein